MTLTEYFTNPDVLTRIIVQELDCIEEDKSNPFNAVKLELLGELNEYTKLLIIRQHTDT